MHKPIPLQNKRAIAQEEPRARELPLLPQELTYEHFIAANNLHRTESLVLESCSGTLKDAVFTFRLDDYTKDGRMYFSLPKLYLAYCVIDPTEYTLAKEVFKTWAIWEKVSSSVGIKGKVAELRREVEVTIKSQAIRHIAEEMHSNGKQAFQASKLLLDKGWVPKEETSVAKKKLKASENSKINSEIMGLLSEDADRLGLTLPKPPH